MKSHFYNTITKIKLFIFFFSFDQMNLFNTIKIKIIKSPSDNLNESIYIVYENRKKNVCFHDNNY